MTIKPKNIKDYIRKNLTEILIGIILFILAFSIRSFQIDKYLFFGFEQGRDAITAMNIANFHDFVLVGPKTDVGGIFHGAWYYYLIAISYGLSGGDPLVTSGLLIILSALVPVMLFLLLRQMNLPLFWTSLGGLLAVFSFRLIEYGRWLSNVSPSVFFSSLAFISLWQVVEKRSERHLIIFSLWYLLAAQFEIILVLFYPPLLLMILIWIRLWPSKKTLFLIVAVALFWFAPMLIFNIRNDWITPRSVLMHYGSSESSMDNRPTQTFELLKNQTMDSVGHILVLNDQFIIRLVLLSTIIFGVAIAIRTKGLKKPAIFFVILILSLFPLLLFPEQAGRSQLYQLFVTLPFPLIGLFVVSLLSLWQWKPVLKPLVMLVILIPIIQIPSVIQILNSNSRAFYRTIQDDLNFQDQKSLLASMNSTGEQYNFQAYTIPYYQSEAWQYLNSYFYDYSNPENPKYYYVIIEKHVDPYWEETWNDDLPPNSLVSEELHGQIRLQKRLLNTNEEQ